MPFIYLARTGEIGNVPAHEVYSMSTATCIVIAKCAYTTRKMAYCGQKMSITNSIIFKLSKYLSLASTCIISFFNVFYIVQLPQKFY